MRISDLGQEGTGKKIKFVKDTMYCPFSDIVKGNVDCVKINNRWIGDITVGERNALLELLKMAGFVKEKEDEVYIPKGAICTIVDTTVNGTGIIKVDGPFDFGMDFCLWNLVTTQEEIDSNPSEADEMILVELVDDTTPTVEFNEVFDPNLAPEEFFDKDGKLIRNVFVSHEIDFIISGGDEEEIAELTEDELKSSGDGCVTGELPNWISENYHKYPANSDIVKLFYASQIAGSDVSEEYSVEEVYNCM